MPGGTTTPILTDYTLTICPCILPTSDIPIWVHCIPTCQSVVTRAIIPTSDHSSLYETTVILTLFGIDRIVEGGMST